jgi:hypothetical protein
MTIQAKDQREALAVLNLTRSADWKTVRGILDASRDETLERLVRGVDDAALHRLQGYARCLTDFLVMADNSEAAVEKFKR